MTAADSHTASASRVRAAIELRRYTEALAEAEKLVAQQPENPDAHGLLAQCHICLKQPSKALRAAENGLRLAPEMEWLHRIRALSLLGLGTKRDLKEALVEANHCCELAPELPVAHYARGKVFAAMGRRYEARGAFSRALELNADYADAHFAVGLVWLESKDPVRAEDHFRQGLRLEPGNALALNNLGVSLLRQKRLSEATEAFKAAVLADPTLALAKNNTRIAVRSRLGLDEERTVVSRVASTIWMLANPALLVVIGPIFVGQFLWRRARAKKKLESLEQSDPRLHRMYHRIEDDHRKGRL